MLRDVRSSRLNELRAGPDVSRVFQRLALEGVLEAFTAVLATALKLASATSVACFTAFCTDSRALLPAATALLNTATAVSLPAGAFLAALSTMLMNLRCASVAVASKF